MNPKIVSVFTLAVASVLLPAVSASAVNVSLSGTAPSGESIYKSQNVSTGYGNMAAFSYGTIDGGVLVPHSAQSVAQSFSTIGSTTPLQFNAFSFYIGGLESGVFGKGFEINIYQADTITGASPASATLLSTQNGVLPSSMARLNYITFELDSAVLLAADKYYTVEFSFTDLTGSGASTSSLRFYTLGAGVNNSVDGRRWLSTTNAAGETTIQSQTSNGLIMFIDATPIPEPSTYSLIGCALVVSYVFLRRRMNRSR